MSANEIGRQPPCDLEAEMSLLGSMLLDAQAIGQVMQIIPREEVERFYRPDHREIYLTLVDLYDQNKAIDIVTLRDELNLRAKLADVGGVEYLIELSESVPSAASAEHYARIVRDKGLLRDLIRCTGNILESAYGARQPAAEVLDDAERRLFAVTEQRVRGKALHVREVLEETFRQIEAREGRRITGVPTGFTELDDLTGGLQNGDMVVVAARPSMGKTALALSMAEHCAADEGLATVFFSMEMSKQQVALRLLSARGRVEGHKIRRGMISAEEQAQLAVICGELCERPLYVDDSTNMTVMELRAKARRLWMMHGVKIIFVDYMQLMADPRYARESRQQEISAISRGLKALARELNIPVVALAQLNRDPEKRNDNRPRMSDLRESGAIEQDADVIILLHREEYYQTHRGRRAGGDGEAERADEAIDPEIRGKAELIIAKQRNGPTDVVEVFFDRKLTRFANLHHGPMGAGGGYMPAAAPLATFGPADAGGVDAEAPF
ncbi:MAG: replicative DNA helicase [Phycisphaerae bacterium]